MALPDEVALEDHIRKTALEIVPERLLFCSLGSHPKPTGKMQFFTVDYDLRYNGYFADFGPLNIAQLVKFCRAMDSELRKAESEDRTIVYYCSHSPHQRANAGFLIGAFALLILRRTADEIWEMLQNSYPTFLPFRDASYGIATFSLTIYDCLLGLKKAVALGWIDVANFNVEEYEQFDAVENGDWNWIVPGKIIAFSSPVDNVAERLPKKVIVPFRERGVQTVVRLNDKLYDRRAFQEVGMRHVEMPFPDGSTPCDTLANQFLELCETEKGAIAVHCKAGLGRTGTMIGLYVLKHFGFSAKEFIAWCRICRPGCVIGCQQHYLVGMERRLSVAGDVHRSRELKIPSQMLEYRAAFAEQQNQNQTSSKKTALLPFMSPTQKGRELERAAQCLVSGERYLATADRLSSMNHDSSRMMNVKVKLFNPPNGTVPPPDPLNGTLPRKIEIRPDLTTPPTGVKMSQQSSRSSVSAKESRSRIEYRRPPGRTGVVRPTIDDRIGTHVCGLTDLPPLPPRAVEEM